MFDPTRFGRYTCALLATVIGVFTGCLPYHADQQSARLLQPGRVEVTPSFTAVSMSSGGEREHVQNQLGLRAGYGMSERAELRGSIERVSIAGVDDADDDAGSVFVIGGGPKFAIVPNKLAFYLPFGAAAGSGVEIGKTFTAAPTLLASFGNNRTFELTPSLKAVLPLTAEEKDVLIGLHLGAGLSSDLERWAIRPELGLLKNPGETGTVVGFTLGFSFRPAAR